jgi:protein O-GlcNAc transferase
MNADEKERSLELAEHYFRDEKYAHAKHLLEKVILVDSNNSKANELLAYIYANSGNFDIALQILTVASHKDDCSIEALYSLGSMQLKISLFNEAIKTFKKTLLKGGEFFEVLHDLATAQACVKDFDSSLDNFQKCIKFSKASFELFFNIARTFEELKRYEESIEYYDKAISLQPDYANAWSNKGNVFNELKRYDDAINSYDKAIRIQPGFAEAWSNKGNVLNELKRYDDAIAHYEKALSLKPDYAEAWCNKGIVLKELKRYEDSIVHYEKALSLKPNIDWLLGDLINTKMKLCNWVGLDEALKDISEKVFANERVVSPFHLLALNDDATLHKKASEIYIQSKFPSEDFLGSILKGENNKKIRIGYFSADFHGHATGYLMAELFELHDKYQFELFGFSIGPIVNDEMRLRLEKSFDHFIEVGQNTDVQIAQLSRNLNIDIAIDLKGITQDSRTGIFSLRAAPIQVSYLGYPSTMGANYIDYIIADQVLVPSNFYSHYQEKVVYLPDSYQVNDRKRLISSRKFTKKELGLPDYGFVFCCFNNNYKIQPQTFDGWMRILSAVEGSVLWLFKENSYVVENLKKEAQKRSIDPHRLVFADRLEMSEHLARHRQADLFLDTFPYNAHTTTSDALWSGLPLITLKGRSFASRVAASLLSAIGLPELITNNQEEYETLAIELAKNAHKYSQIKEKLDKNRLNTPLFDTPRFTKNLEAAYIKMHERHKAQLTPEHIAII